MVVTMGRARRFNYASDDLHRASGPSRTALVNEVRCKRCDEEAVFDGNGGEWCPSCRSSKYLVVRQCLYRLVDVALD